MSYCIGKFYHKVFKFFNDLLLYNVIYFLVVPYVFNRVNFSISGGHWLGFAGCFKNTFFVAFFRNIKFPLTLNKSQKKTF